MMDPDLKRKADAFMAAYFAGYSFLCPSLEPITLYCPVRPDYPCSRQGGCEDKSKCFDVAKERNSAGEGITL